MSTYIKTVTVDFVEYFDNMSCFHQEVCRYGCMSALYMDAEVFTDMDMDMAAWGPNFRWTGPHFHILKLIEIQLHVCLATEYIWFCFATCQNDLSCQPIFENENDVGSKIS